MDKAGLFGSFRVVLDMFIVVRLSLVSLVVLNTFQVARHLDTFWLSDLSVWWF